MKYLLRLGALAAMLLGLGFSGPAQAQPAVNMQAEYERTVIAPESASLHVIINFKALEARAGEKRPPMSLALVIDRSGSMSEAGKLNYAKMAARDLVKRLNERDSLALVVYDTEVDLLFAVNKMSRANRDKVLRQIDGLSPSSATNLSGGMAKGFEQLAKADSAGMKRVILLSDGLANQGETVPSRIAAMAAAARQKGITLSAMGLGQDYDEDLMQLIAQRGGGNYYYIRNPEDSSRFFASELKGVLDSVTKDIRLTLTLGEGVKDVKIYGYTQNGGGRQRQVDISDFYSGEERMMVLEYQLEPGASGSLQLGEARLEYAAITEGGAKREEGLPLEVSVNSDEKQQQASASRQVEEQVLALRADEKYALALDAASQGQFAEAEKIINETKTLLSDSSLTASSELLSGKAEAFALESQRISTVAAAPVPAQQEYIKMGRSRVYNSSKGNLNMEQMKPGSRGLEVELLQKALQQAGFYQGALDGVYSAEVEEAVRKFQAQNRLKADGIAGPATQNRLGMY